VRIFFELLILGGFIAWAWSQQWFGIFSTPVSKSVVAPKKTLVLATQPVSVTGSDGRQYSLRPINAWEVGSIVLQRQEYSDTLSVIAPEDYVIAWGVAAQLNRKKIVIEAQSRTAIIGSKDLGTDIAELMSTIGVVHLIPGNAEIADLLTKIRPGTYLGLKGWLVGANIGRESFEASTAATDAAPAGYNVYVREVNVEGAVAKVSGA